MLIQIVKFESALTETEVDKVARDRKPEYEAQPGLLQKYYVKLGDNRYGGVMIWDGPESLAKFRESDLAKTIGPSYGVVGAPDICVHEVMFPLRAIDLAAA